MRQDRPVGTSGIRPLGYFVLRTPMLAFDALLEWADGMSACTSSDTDSERAIEAECAVLRVRLKRAVSQPHVREALYVASPSTFDALDQWLTTPDLVNDRLERTVSKYFQRMAARCTPFGLFAGYSLGTVGASTSFELGSLETYRRSTRIDHDVLFAICASLSADPDVRSRMTYSPNTSLYRIGTQWRYVRTLIRGTQRVFSLVALDTDEFLQIVLSRAANGATIEDLVVHILASDPDGDIARDEAAVYVNELIDREILLPPIFPLITGRDALDDLIEELRLAGITSATVGTLEQIRERLETLDRAPIGTRLGDYAGIHGLVKTILPHASASRLFQVDFRKPEASVTCDEALIARVGRGIELLRRISPDVRGDALRRFREAFSARYERRAVPLTEVLDEDAGIGFDKPSSENTPLLDGIPFDTPSERRATWTNRDEFLLGRVTDTIQSASTSLELTHDDVLRLSNPHPTALPDAFTVMATVWPRGDGVPPTQSEPGVLIRQMHGPSGANMFARFAQADPLLHEFMLAHLRTEESFSPHAIFAEVVHLPDSGRLGNVLARPVLRDHEIPYLGRSGADRERQIHVADLLVSIRDDGRIVLTSERLGQEVIPRLTNAHNFRHGQPIYRFLCALQAQHTPAALSWSWGALDGLPFLPRVEHAGIVLSRARWKLTSHFDWAKLSRSARLNALGDWWQTHRLPRFACLADFDNELPVDSHNALSVEAFLGVIKRRPSATLVEMYPDSSQLCARGTEGAFAHELLLPFVQNRDKLEVKTQPYGTGPSPSRRSFQPGSEWLYVKWYAGTAAADRVLSTAVLRFVREKITPSETWFFVRYSDPDPHIRFRIQVSAEHLQSTILPGISALGTELMEAGLVWKMQMDTYEREVERYGGRDGIDVSERLFCCDSRAVLDLLQLCAFDAGTELRWKLCLVSCDTLLDDLGFSLDAKHRLVSEGRAALGQVLNASKRTEISLSGKYRRFRKSLSALLSRDASGDEKVTAAFEVLLARSQEILPLARSLRELERARALTVPLMSLARSYLHMHVNRMLRSSQNVHEFVIYDFLAREYESRIARARRKV